MIYFEPNLSIFQETYRTEKLSRTVHADGNGYVLRLIINSYHLTSCSRDSSILPEDLATQSVRLKEEQLRREEEKVRFSTRR